MNNRNRLIYRVEGNDGTVRNVRTFNAAIRLAFRVPGGWICQGEKTVRGIRWNRKRQWSVRP